MRQRSAFVIGLWLAISGWSAPVGSAAIRYREVAREWGVDFRHVHGGTGELYMIETMGSGVVVFDYDGDGDHDLFFVQSGTLPLPGADLRYSSALYRNEGSGRFIEISRRAQIDLRVYGMGATAGDVDNDGDLDLYVTAFGTNHLLRNRGDGTFVDVTEESGVGDPLWGASTSLSDVDRDGDLDLYVTNYVDFSFDNNPPCGLPKEGLRSYCHPDVYDGLPDRFFRNRGDGTFVEETAASGFGAADGKGLGVIFGDFDRDGWPDLYVANDMTANFLFHNLGDGRFEEIAVLAGAAYGERGGAEAGMGVALGDVDGNGFQDIVVTHLDQQMTALYSNTGLGVFVDMRYPSQLAEPSWYNVGFGVELADLNLDGALDVVFANGHIIHNAELWGTGTSFRQRNQIMENLGDGRFREIADAGLDVVLSSRGLATGDLDGDGDLELVFTNSDDRVELYENVSEGVGGWLQVDLHSPRATVGSQVEMTTAAGSQLREARAGASYLSQSAGTIHFGTGDAERIERLRVHWNSGGARELRGLPAGRRLLMYE